MERHPAVRVRVARRHSWVGLGVFVGTNVIAMLIWSVVLASRKQTKLTYASTLSGESREAMYDLAGRLRSRRELRN
jgi:hypothetical protein